MAESRVIAAYLTELRYSVGRLGDADDIVDEASDHLHAAVDALVAGGTARVDAEHQALARFGSASLVARVFAEEARRGAAVSTSLTRRAGAAAIASVVLIGVGEAGNEMIRRGAFHGVAVAMIVAGFALFAVALWGLRRRHGGLGSIGRIAFWWFVLSPLLALPGGYAAGWILLAEWLLILSVLGVGMIRAGILPTPAVVLSTITPFAAVTVALALSVAGIDLGNWAYSFAAPAGVGCVWLGWAMLREPALDVHQSDEPFARA